MINNYLININKLTKNYKVNKNKIIVINGLSINFENNCIVSVIGPSGSGKSTFLNIIGLLDKDFEGTYKFNGKNIKELNKKQIHSIRGRSIGFIHQFFHLIPELTVIENVALPYLINFRETEAFTKAKKLLEIFGLSARLSFKPIKLSGGEQQRVAIARSLINNPDLILADEMTGNLDEYTSKEIFSFFLSYLKQKNKSLIYVTHNQNFANQANSIYKFTDSMLEKIK